MVQQLVWVRSIKHVTLKQRPQLEWPLREVQFSPVPLALLRLLHGLLSLQIPARVTERVVEQSRNQLSSRIRFCLA